MMPALTMYQTEPGRSALFAAKARFESMLGRQLQVAPSGEVVLYIHGFNETFKTAADTMGELCHYLGREHACGIFTWPASARGNFLIFCVTTTESATFAVDHLTKTIRMIGATPGVERVHLIAHSLGTGLLVEALRELAIESYATGVEPLDSFKLGNVILASPDMGTDVAEQSMQVFTSNPDRITRWSKPYQPEAFDGRWTVYASPKDLALSVSRILFRSNARLGQVNLDALAEEEVDAMYREHARFDIIVYRGKRTDWFGHGYFYTNPPVSPDLIQMIRYGVEPGAPGRPLEQVISVAWTFPEEE